MRVGLLLLGLLILAGASVSSSRAPAVEDVEHDVSGDAVRPRLGETLGVDDAASVRELAEEVVVERVADASFDADGFHGLCVRLILRLCKRCRH